jgi:AcrR family transcriptional regulator
MPRRGTKREGALYRRLPPGTHGIGHEQVRRNQRARLQGAMVAAVARRGYAKTTIGAVVDLAGVSRTTFYEHFQSKEDCFLQTYDLIVELEIERIMQAYRSADSPRERLYAAFAALTAIVSSEPESARFVIIEALVAGDVALEHRERAVQAFERLLRQSFGGSQGQVSDVTLRAIVGGVQRIVYVRLREGRLQELDELVDELVDWTLSYQAVGVKPPTTPGVRRAASPSVPRLEVSFPEPARARLELSQRERILLAVSSLVAERGYPPLTIPAITARAGVSNQTFYEHFKSKEEAFLAAFDDNAAAALRATTTAFQAAPSLPDAVREAVHALLSYTVSHPAFARLGFFEVLTTGTAAQERSEHALQGFIDLLSPGANRPPGVPSVAEQAIAGGIVSVIQREIAYDRLPQLACLTASLAYVALAPFLGAAAATRIAQRR